jgi:anti-sigma regulatory factor (Ser/Thr protein kinase)
MSENSSHSVEMLLPLSEEWARLVRLFVAGAAQQCGASISLIDDAKLVSEEAFLLGLAVTDAERQVTIAVSCAEGGINLVVGGLPPQSADERTCGPYSLFILNALATETRWVSRDGSVDLEVLLTEREADG